MRTAVSDKVRFRTVIDIEVTRNTNIRGILWRELLEHDSEQFLRSAHFTPLQAVAS
jgi:hypothetical protein